MIITLAFPYGSGKVKKQIKKRRKLSKNQKLLKAMKNPEMKRKLQIKITTNKIKSQKKYILELKSKVLHAEYAGTRKKYKEALKKAKLKLQSVQNRLKELRN